MPRPARAAVGGSCYHPLNRGQGRAAVFPDEGDYAHLVRRMRQTCARVPMQVIGSWSMPNPFPVVLWPPGDDNLGTWMQRWLTSHAPGYRKRHRGSGHVGQGRFKAFPIAADDHLLAVLRYVERHPLRANLVSQAADWRWSSLRDWLQPAPLPWFNPGPVPRPPDWLEIVQAPHTEAELAALRRRVRRNAPYSSADWVAQTARALGLESRLRAPGRPRREGSADASGASVFRSMKS